MPVNSKSISSQYAWKIKKNPKYSLCNCRTETHKFCNKDKWDIIFSKRISNIVKNCLGSLVSEMMENLQLANYLVCCNTE